MLFSLPLCALALASAEMQRCGAHDAIVAQLARRYGESRKAIPLDGANQVVEAVASTTREAWRCS